MRIKANLPTVPVYEITLHPRDNAMLLATHGRSVWILDDVTPLQEFARAQAADAFMFTARAAVHRRSSDERMKSFEGDRQFLGKTADRGAAFTFHLKSPVKEAVIAVSDSAGTLVREIKGAAMKDKAGAGINRVIWDLRVEPLPRPEGQETGAGGFGGGGVDGPMVLPGSYQVALRVDGKEVAKQSFSLAGDPEIKISDEDRRVLFNTAMELHRLQKTANEGANALTRAGEQFAAAQRALRDNSGAPEALKKGVEETDKKLEAVRRKFGIGGGGGGGGGMGGPGGARENVRGQIGQLKNAVMASTSKPTDVQTKQAARLRGDLEKAIEEANAFLGGLPALYRELADKSIFPVPPGSIAKIPK
jgi:hypothetical protein